MCNKVGKFIDIIVLCNCLFLLVIFFGYSLCLCFDKKDGKDFFVDDILMNN